MENLLNNHVALSWTDPRYPDFPYAKTSTTYRALQDLFRGLELNPDNPFEGAIAPGQTALIKPNWVRDFHPDKKGLDCLVSHVSLIRHLIDFLAVAMEGRGIVVIADAPLQNCDFQQLLQKTGADRMIAEAKVAYPQLEIVAEDWRLTTMERRNWVTSWNSHHQQTSKDHFGKEASSRHQIVDLGTDSFLEEISDLSDRFRVTCYKSSMMQQHHRPGKHEFLITKRVFEVDFMINLSKMKTHIKAGLTGALKSLIGINGHKEFLPHHIKGPWLKGGDNYLLPNWFRERYEDVYDRYWENFAEMPILRRKFLGLLLQVLWKASLVTSQERISAGSWRGNETVWRTTLDLNHALYFLGPHRPRKILNIVDGIIAGEKEGPLSPDPKPLGLLIGGENPATVDAVMTKIMGYHLSRIPTVYHALFHRRSRFGGLDLAQWSATSTRNEVVEKIPFKDLPNHHFVKPKYWRSA